MIGEESELLSSKPLGGESRSWILKYLSADTVIPITTLISVKTVHVRSWLSKTIFKVNCENSMILH